MSVWKKMGRIQLAKTAIQKAFPGIYSQEVEKMISIGEVNEYPAKTCLCVEGNVEETFYILLDGEVSVTKVINNDEDRLLNILKPGDFFGEMGLIHEAPRAASVTSVGSVQVLEIDKASFNQTLQKMSIVSMAMVREVSQRLRDNDEMAIEDLRQKAGELASAYQQLAELDVVRREFLTTIAHELRTPLTSANGYLQMVQMGMLEGPALDQALGAISKNITRIIGLTNDILFLQEMDLIFSDFDEIDLGAMLTELAVDLAGFAEEMGVIVSLEVDEDLPVYPGDRKSIKRTFRALLDNAIKFSVNGGDVKINISKGDGRLVVKITDEGIGIPLENQEKIWDRFWRTEEYEGHLFSGIGLGLAIAMQVITQHGGELSVESTLGAGSVFIVMLPIGE
jgi:signal transduction histidine kinase